MDWTLEHPQGLLEAAPDAIVVVTADGRIALVNAQAQRLFGYRRDELIGQPVEILTPEATRHLHPAHRNRYLDDPRPRPMGAGVELAARRKDGTEFPAEISLSAINTPDGVLVATAIRDVTDRRHAAEAQARLASIVQSSHDAIISETLDGVVTSWNPAAERIYGYTAQEMIGQLIYLLVPPDRRADEAAVIARVAKGERVERGRTDRVRKDGRMVSVAATISPIVDAVGGIVGAASVSRDLSEQELAEAKFRGLLEAAPDAIVGVDAEGRVVLANAQTEQLFGYQRSELIGQPVEILMPAGMHEAHVAQRAGYFADPRPRPMGAGRQLTARRRDGTEFPVEISLSAVHTEDGLLVSAAIRDVTERIEAQAERDRLRAQAERERLESQLQQSRRLESLGQLAGGVAHDFNNLLAVILNYSAFVAEELGEAAIGEPDRWNPVLRDVEQVQKATDRAIALTHQLLAFGRRELVRPRVLNLNDVVGDVEQLLRRTIGEHVKLDTRLGADLWPVKADPGQFEQVLVNLAVNARDAMPTGGTLTIDTANVDVDEAYLGPGPGPTPGRHVRLRVSDTGVGMAADVVAKAFEPFFTTKPKGEGTGLGLATVYGVIAQAGGHTSISSQPGLGTTISTLIPATDEEASDATAAPAAGARGRGGETVLVVEDEDAIREVTGRILRRNGYQVMTAAGGAEALELAQQHRGDVHLLLTDVIMPQMLGKEVAERVTALRPPTRVLFMSGYAEQVLANQGTLDAGVALVEKPFSENTLLDAVREVLDA